MWDDRPSRLDEEEFFAIFRVVATRGTVNDAQLCLSPRHRTTVAAAFRVAEELFRRDPDTLSTREAVEIADRVGYRVSRARVVELHRQFRLWKARGQEKLGAGEAEEQPGVQEARAELTMEFAPERSEDQGSYAFAEGQQARFCCVRVRNRGKITAQQCIPTLGILSPQNARRLSHYNLHWAFDDPYLPVDVERPIDIVGGGYRRLDVAFALPPSQNKASETVVDPGMTTGRRTTIILPSAPTSRDTFEAKARGCWIATHLALSTYRPGDQYHLAPGDYLVKVEVRWNHGENEAKCFRVFSPSDWRKLRMELVECPEATN